jgi:amidase
MDLCEYASNDATALADLVRGREVTAVELVQLGRDLYGGINSTINVVAELNKDAETDIGSETGPFCRVPLLKKDRGASGGRPPKEHSSLLRGPPTFARNLPAYPVPTTQHELGTASLSDSIARRNAQPLET